MAHGFSFLLATSLLLASGAAVAAEAPQWEAGKNYQLIEPAVETSSDTVEVVEVFSYACPHCANFQPFAERIKAELPAGATYEYKPAVFFPQWEPYARAFLVAKSMGILDKAHGALFDALHRDHRPIRSLQDLAHFYADFGVEPGQFLSTAESFVINDELQKDVLWGRRAGVMGTPTIIVAGKYRAEASGAGGNAQLVELTKWLVDKELAARQQQ